MASPTPQPKHWATSWHVWSVGFSSWMTCFLVSEALIANPTCTTWIRRVALAVVGVVVSIVVLGSAKQLAREDKDRDRSGDSE